MMMMMMMMTDDDDESCVVTTMRRRKEMKVRGAWTLGHAAAADTILIFEAPTACYHPRAHSTIQHTTTTTKRKSRG
jgi:hypothetical protein